MGSSLTSSSNGISGKPWGKATTSPCLALILLLLLNTLSICQAAFAQGNIDSEEKLGVKPNEVVVGSCAPLTGQMKIRGTEVVGGGKLYFNYINEKGGVHGRKISLVSCDDQYTAEAAETCFFTNLKDKVFLGTLFQGTANGARYIKRADQFHMPMVGFSMGANFASTPTRPTIFQVRPTLTVEANELVNTLYNKLHLHKIAIVYQDDSYGAACKESAEKALQKYGATPCRETACPRFTHDVNPVLNDLRKGEAQAVIVGVGGDAAALLVEGIKLAELPVQIGAFSLATDLLMKEAMRASDGVILSQAIPFTHADLPAVKQYKELAKKAGLQVTVSGFEGFLIAKVVVEGLQKTGPNLTRSRFVEAMESMHNVDIGLGSLKLDFSHDEHDGLKAGAYSTIIKNGQLVDLDTARVAELKK